MLFVVSLFLTLRPLVSLSPPGQQNTFISTSSTINPTILCSHKKITNYNNNKIMTWSKEHYFISPVDNIKIQYATLEHDDHINNTNSTINTIIFFTGWKETYLNYKEMLETFYKEGFNVYTMDHRSQGLSEDTPGSWNSKGHSSSSSSSSSKEGVSGKRICYVNDFETTYVADAYHFIQEIVKPSLCSSNSGTNNNICVVSHSMGGPITARLAQLHPNLFDRMVLTAPMLMHKNILDIGGLVDIELPPWLSYAVGWFITSIGLGRMKADGRDTDASIPTTELLTNNESNIRSWNALRKAYPQVVLSGCSFGWVHAATQLERKVRREKYKIKIPTLVVGSDNDSFVYTKAMEEFCHSDDDRNVGNEDLFTFIGPLQGSYHEILLERKKITDPLIPLICAFSKSTSTTKFDYKDMPLPPIVVDELQPSSRWKKGHHSGSWPPRFLPIPLLFRSNP